MMRAGRALDALIAKKVTGFKAQPGLSEVPPYSTDIFAAWLVVEKLKEDGNNVWVGYYGDQWHMHFTEDGLSECPADTAPLAICLAAMKAVEQPEPLDSIGE